MGRAKGGADLLIAHFLLGKIIITRQVWSISCKVVRGASVGAAWVVCFMIVVGRAAKFEADIIEAYRSNAQ